MSRLRTMSEEDCRQRLSEGVVGRLAYAAHDGPHVVPVAYSVIAGAVVFRTSPYSLFGSQVRDAHVAFETDRIDEASHTGWSVVARGRCEAVLDPKELADIASVWPPDPWPDGLRSLHYRIRWDELTGRDLVAVGPGERHLGW